MPETTSDKISKQYINTLKVTCPNCDYEHQDRVYENWLKLCSNCGQPFEITVNRIKTGRRVQDRIQSVLHDEYTFMYSTKPHTPAGYDLSTIKSFDEAVGLYNAGKINKHQLHELVEKHGWEITMFVDGFTDDKFLAKDRNPFNPDGDNTAREHGFTYNPHCHPQGIVFQKHIKIIMRRMIDLAYGAFVKIYGRKRTNVLNRWILKTILKRTPGTIKYLNRMMETRYDKDAFVFQDPFLVRLREILLKRIKDDFQWADTTEEPAIKLMDIVLALLKEDMPYRIGAKQIINELIAKYPNGFELTKLESQHIARMKIAKEEWMARTKKTK